VAQGEIIGVAPNYDLAVLRIKNARQYPPAGALGSRLTQGRSIGVCDRQSVRVDQSLTSGIISALKRRAADQQRARYRD